MSAVVDVMKSIIDSVRPRPSLKEQFEMATSIESNARCFDAHLSRLASTPVTVEALLTGNVQHGIDFAHYDALLARAEKMLAEVPEAAIFEYGVPVSLSTLVEQFRGVLQRAEPYRSAGKK